MLKNLRRQFVAIIMVLVGLVLVSVLGGSLISAYRTQHDQTYQILEHSLHGEPQDLPPIKIGSEGDDGLPEHRGANALILRVDLTSADSILRMNDSPVTIEANVLTNVLTEAIESNDDRGWDKSLHIAWICEQRQGGIWRVVIADTSSTDAFLQRIAIDDLLITLAAMALLFVISLGLSSWVLRPVESAWSQQRQFVADASHELKTPLAVIIANTQILERDDAIPQEARRWVDSTADEAQHMKGLVEELLELARTDESAAGLKGVMQHDVIDFSSLVESSALEFDAIAFERGSLIEERIDDGIRVTGDRTWLERLCKILIDNACKYSYKGETIVVSLQTSGRKCTLSVNNHGDAIDEEDLRHIFDRFYRTDKARTRNGNASGFGLGLAIAKGIVDVHGGSISATSNAQDGTTFVAVLPMAA